MEWITAKEAAEQWNLSKRRVQYLCINNQIEGAKKLATIWVIPKGTLKPIDGRTKAAKQRIGHGTLQNQDRQ